MFLFMIMHESTGKYPYAKTFFFSADIDSKIAKGEKKLNGNHKNLHFEFRHTKMHY